MGFVDLQVNGYAGIDFNGETVTRGQMNHVYQKLRAGGMRAVLPTIITDEPVRMATRLANLRALIDEQPSWRKMFPAFHIEGPCLSPEDGYRGAHPQQYICRARPDVLEPLIEAAGGPMRVAIVTLAPEMDDDLATTRWLAELDVIIAAGHTDASHSLLRESEQAGLRLFTHLSNGCKSLVPRHDNIINRALALDQIHYTFIPDGHHIPFFVLKGYLKQAGLKRSILVSDCMAAAAAPPGRYRIGHWELAVGPDRRVHPPGQDHLAGSALTMPEAFAHATKHLGLTENQAKSLCSDQPARLLARWLT